MNKYVDSSEKIYLLHIAAAGIKDKFYQVFLKKLQEAGILHQTIYIPYRTREYSCSEIQQVEKFSEIKEGIDVFSSPIKSTIDRVFYFSKIRKYARVLETNKKIGKYHIIHAHHLFSDGGVAYIINKKYNIPYVVSVRTTDTEYFMKYFFHTRMFMKKILLNSSKIICVNPTIKDNLLKKIKNSKIKELIMKKIIVIPNGVDDFWIDNKYSAKKISTNSIRLLQVGSLIKRKNHKCTFHAVKILKDKGYDITLDVVGTGPKEKELVLLRNKLGLNDDIIFHGFIKDKNEILSLYRMADIFVLPSFTETFGIAYVEAMSQGLPVIYSKGQGLDGYYENGDIGLSIDPRDPNNLVSAVLKIAEKYYDISNKCIDNSEDYRWNAISETLRSIYLENINNPF